MVVIHLLGASANAQAPQPNVTPYNWLSVQLQMQPGQSYLGFMLSTVNPALNTFDSVIRQDRLTTSQRIRQLQVDLITQKAGVAIRIDSNNYFFNVGYNNGTGGSGMTPRAAAAMELVPPMAI